MEPNDTTTKYAEALKAVKLSAAARARMEDALGAYADFHAADTQKVDEVRDADVDRSTTWISKVSTWYTAFFTHAYRNTMPLYAFLAILLVGGGTSLAAQNSLPGELLYPIKVGVNENVRLAMAVTPDAQTEVALALLEERVREARALQLEGRLDGELAYAVDVRIEAQVKAAEEASEESEAVTAVAASEGIDTALAHYNSLVGRDDRLVIAALVDSGAQFEPDLGVTPTGNGTARAVATLNVTAPYAAKAESDSQVSTMLAIGPAPLAVLHENARIHFDALNNVLTRHEGEIRADQLAELRAMLKEAEALMARALVESNEELARPHIQAATQRIGEVEAALTLLGEATVDMETGAITDIDFSRKPAPAPEVMIVDPMPREILHYDEGSAAGGGVDAVIDISNDMIETSAGAASQFSF